MLVNERYKTAARKKIAACWVIKSLIACQSNQLGLGIDN